MTPSVRDNAVAAIQALQQWYCADSFAASTGLYHYTESDADFSNDVGSSALATLIKSAGYENAFVDGNRYWNSANAITALIDYMELTRDFSYLSVIEQTFALAPNAFTIDQGWAVVGGLGGLAAGAAAGAATGSFFGPAGTVLGGIAGGLAGLFGGGATAAATFARVYFTNFLNGAYDDEGWWALAWLRAYDITHDTKYLKQAAVIFDDLTSAWDSVCKGGIYWKLNHMDSNGKGPYKNSITNELFIAVAAGLYLRYAQILPAGDAQLQSYWDWACNKAWPWFNSSGLINSNNLINDSFDYNPTTKSWTCSNTGTTFIFTYNQGVIIGALCDLFEITHENSLMEQARGIADALITNPVTWSQSGPNASGVINGILTEEADSHNPSIDMCQFKGIFIRNFAKLWAKSGRPERYKKFILLNYRSVIATKDSNNHYGASWSSGPPDSVDFVRQTSALDLINAALAVQGDMSYLELLLGRERHRDISYLFPLLLG